MADVPKDIQEILDQMDETCGCQAMDKKGRTCDCIKPVAHKGEQCVGCRQNGAHVWR